MNRYEKQKLAVEKAMSEKVAAYQAIYKKADEEDRDPTDEERLESSLTSRRSRRSRSSAVRPRRTSRPSRRRGHRPRARPVRLLV
jgi:hypothetical protein